MKQEECTKESTKGHKVFDIREKSFSVAGVHAIVDSELAQAARTLHDSAVK